MDRKKILDIHQRVPHISDLDTHDDVVWLLGQLHQAKEKIEELEEEVEELEWEVQNLEDELLDKDEEIEDLEEEIRDLS